MHTDKLITNKDVLDELSVRLALLENDARTALLMAVAQLTLALENDGCAVVAVDPDGGGKMCLMILGDAEEAPLLMGAVADMKDKLFTAPEGLLQ